MDGSGKLKSIYLGENAFSAFLHIWYFLVMGLGLHCTE